MSSTTVEDLLQPPDRNYWRNPQEPVFAEESVPDLNVEFDGNHLSHQEVFHLLLHLWAFEIGYTGAERFLPRLHELIPPCSRDALAEWLLAQDYVVAAVAIAGPTTRRGAISAVLDSAHEGREKLLAACILFPLNPVASLPLCAWVIEHFPDQWGFWQISAELKRRKKQIDEPGEVWDLLLLPSTTKDAAIAQLLEQIMQRCVQFAADEFEQAIEHPRYGPMLKGLVHNIHTGAEIRQELWPFQLKNDERVSIVHPIMLSTAEITKWKARASHENRTPPFDQWSEAKTPRGPHSLDGLTTDPSTLLLHLEAMGWERTRPDGRGILRSHTRRFPGLKLRAILEYDGIPTMPGSVWSHKSISQLRFEHLTTGAPVEAGHPVALAHIRHDLQGLRSPTEAK